MSLEVSRFTLESFQSGRPQLPPGCPAEQKADEEVNGPEEEESEEQTLMYHQEGEIFNEEKKTLDWRNQRVTDLRDCPKLILPTPRPTSEEMVMATKETMWSLRYSQYQARNCDEEGRIRMDNMTKSERRGFVKLNKRTHKKRNCGFQNRQNPEKYCQFTERLQRAR